MLKTIYHFFRLIRFANLLVIGITMVVVELLFLRYDTLNIPQDYINYNVFGYHYSEITDFLPLVVSTLLVAAAGNIINDYFDVKADRVNKPDRLIIGKHIKRRWAMVLHWGFNSVGMILSLIIGYHLQNIWVPLITFMSINLLWFYSAYYKRTPFVGNLIVALLIGILPIFVLVYNFSIFSSSHSYITGCLIGVSLIAFLQNLVRELVKDIQDVRGDVRLGAKTFPIKFGIKRTKWLISIISVLTILSMFGFFGFVANHSLNPNFTNLCDLQNVLIILSASGFFFMVAFLLTIFAKKIKTYKIASTLLKVAMLFGLLTPLFL